MKTFKERDEDFKRIIGEVERAHNLTITFTVNAKYTYLKEFPGRKIYFELQDYAEEEYREMEFFKQISKIIHYDKRDETYHISRAIELLKRYGYTINFRHICYAFNRLNFS